MRAQGQLFQALRTNKLVPPGASWQDISYSRCGRTDKGVSALGQVGCENLRAWGLAPKTSVVLLVHVLTFSRVKVSSDIPVKQ